MSDTPITERQQHWLDHIQAAEAFDGSIADYARSEGLKPKELYSWKGILARRGLLADARDGENGAGFVRVIAPVTVPQKVNHLGCGRLSTSAERIGGGRRRKPDYSVSDSNA